MFNRLVLESLRARPYQTAGCIALSALASAALLTCVGIHRGIGPEPSLQRLMVGVWASGLLLCVTVVAFSVIVLVQYVEVRERTQDYGILRVLGASTRHFLTLLAVEGFLISLPGTVCGIVLAYAAKVIVILAFSRYLTLSAIYWAWPATLLCSFVAFTVGGLIGARKAVRDGVEEALTYHK